MQLAEPPEPTIGEAPGLYNAGRDQAKGAAEKLKGAARVAFARSFCSSMPGAYWRVLAGVEGVDWLIRETGVAVAPLEEATGQIAVGLGRFLACYDAHRAGFQAGTVYPRCCIDLNPPG